MFDFFSKPEPPPKKSILSYLIPATRFIVAVMMFFATWVNYMLRVNISVNLIAMCPPDTEDDGKLLRSDNITYIKRANEIPLQSVKQPPGTVTFKWTEQEQAYVLSGYFWGYSSTCWFAGVVAEYWGPKRIVFLTTMLGALLTVLSPAAARIHYGVLFGCRVVCGMGGGFLYPSLHNLVAHWSPPAEKGKFVSALLGGAIGTVATWSITGPLIEDYGWDYAFYVPGALAMLFAIIWMFVVYDTPVQHPRIDTTEKEYILSAIGAKVHHSQDQTARVIPPFKHIMTSSPFLAMTVLQFGSLWGLYFIMTAAPKFMTSALGFNLARAGGIASLPYLGRMIFAVIFGSIGDRIVRDKLLTMTVMRKTFVIFSHIFPAIFLIILGYNNAGSTALNVTLITVSMAFNGAACLTNLANHQDLAPNFAGTLYGIATAIGTISGFICPIVTAHFIQHGPTMENWRPVFLVGASIYVGCAIYFIIFGSGETQKWNALVRKGLRNPTMVVSK